MKYNNNMEYLKRITYLMVSDVKFYQKLMSFIYIFTYNLNTRGGFIVGLPIGNLKRGVSIGYLFILKLLKAKKEGEKKLSIIYVYNFLQSNQQSEESKFLEIQFFKNSLKKCLHWFLVNRKKLRLIVKWYTKVIYLQKKLRNQHKMY